MGSPASSQRRRSTLRLALAEDRKEESWEAMEALREKHTALRQRRSRTSDIATQGQIERELCEVEEQLVSKKIAERLPVSMAAKSAATCHPRSCKAEAHAPRAGQRQVPRRSMLDDLLIGPSA